MHDIADQARRSAPISRPLTCRRVAPGPARRPAGRSDRCAARRAICWGGAGRRPGSAADRCAQARSANATAGQGRSSTRRPSS
jgi:hypothetical protein